MSLHADTITTISVKNCADYLPMIRKVAACLADNAGMDACEVNDASNALMAACRSESGSDNAVSITVKASDSHLAMEVVGGRDKSARHGKYFNSRLTRKLSGSVELMRRRGGVSIRLVKQSKSRRRLRWRLRELAASCLLR